MNQLIASSTQLGEILRSARRSAGLTQLEAATRLGLSQSRLSALELDPKIISVEQLLALMGLYRLDLVVQSRDVAPVSSNTEW
ncbi:MULTISPECIES: helix-turn-helix domain-containing protein [Pandoraea]|uniref:Helix-turn-helix domain-containing protein n=1 Tax=Pandoraea commovens TaxID=2508289 RepID=A0A5E4RGZ7_9BURK|nr:MULTISPECIES: helix-turn-helix transcriptional regulator [Pandoraea]MCE4059454.1 helix-turn-helix domain-containing protein [Pandoraea sputorum]UVA81832.1 helix-turn-helix domain-containing protein [Pandoraea commovens]VVD61228.1 transcriptional regulator [Pandoraea commovens]